VEATSNRVLGTLVNRDEVWDRCYEDLMAHTRILLEQEVARLGGDCSMNPSKAATMIEVGKAGCMVASLHVVLPAKRAIGRCYMLHRSEYALMHSAELARNPITSTSSRAYVAFSFRT